MRIRAPRLCRETARGQLLLFDPFGLPPLSDLPDLDTLFATLNRRFFEGCLRAKLEWSTRLTASAGSCHPRRRVIRISAGYHQRRPGALPATLAHEMCHLVVADHGPEFRRIAVPIARDLEVSWRDFRYSEHWADLVRYRYLYACPRCGLEHPSRKRRRISCPRCGGGSFSEAHRLVLTESRARPGPVLLGERPVRTG